MKKILLAALAVLSFAACNDTATKTTAASNDSTSMNSNPDNGQEAKEERNKQTALASLTGFATGDVDVILKDADKDMVEYGDGSMAPVKNLDSTRAGLKMWLAAMQDYKGSNITAAADGDYVMIYGTWTGTWKNDFMGMKASGKPFRVNDVDILKFNDAGKIVEHRTIQSMNEIGRQVGMKMPNP